MSFLPSPPSSSCPGPNSPWASIHSHIRSRARAASSALSKVPSARVSPSFRDDPLLGLQTSPQYLLASPPPILRSDEHRHRSKDRRHDCCDRESDRRRVPRRVPRRRVPHHPRRPRRRRLERRTSPRSRSMSSLSRRAAEAARHAVVWIFSRASSNVDWATARASPRASASLDSASICASLPSRLRRLRRLARLRFCLRSSRRLRLLRRLRLRFLQPRARLLDPFLPRLMGI